MSVWRLSWIVNVVALVLGILAVGVIGVVWLWSFVDADADPHGYFLIFGVLAAVLLLIPVSLLAAGAYHLRQGSRIGLVHQVVAGVVVGLYGGVVPSAAARWIGIGLGTVLAAVALIALLVGRRPTGPDSS